MESQHLYQVSEVQLVYKTNVKPSDRIKISNSQDTYKVLQHIWNPDTLELREEFKVLFLNRANRLLGCYDLSTGGVAGTVADPKLIFASALKAMASSIVLAHNHPSGNLEPSKADIELTKRVAAGGKILEILVVDHIIYTSEGFYSFADNGLMYS